jgi:hypothetical protein
MNFTRMKTLGLAAVVATSVLIPVAYASGIFQGYPVVGSAAFCATNNSQQTTTTVPGAAYTSSQCTTTVPAGPTTLTGAEDFVADTNVANGGGQETVRVPSSMLANGFGNTTIATTTGTTAAVVVADGVSNYIYAGAGTATYTSFKLPPNPMQNQQFCLSDAGTGILTLTAVAVGTSGQSIVGVAPTSIPVATAVGTAGTVTLSKNCWLYNVSNTSWYRVL